MTTDASALRARAWVVLLLEAVSVSGLSPIPKDQLHRLVFFSNCLSSIYGEPPLTSMIMKYKRGPYYPRLQWSLDRLTAQGVVQLFNYRHFVDENGLWVDGDYCLSDSGADLAHAVSRAPAFSRMREFLWDLGAAYANLKDSSLSDVALKDVNYVRPGIGEGVVINFSLPEQNYSARTAQAFSGVVPALQGVSTQEELKLYLKYLERQVA